VTGTCVPGVETVESDQPGNPWCKATDGEWYRWKLDGRGAIVVVNRQRAARGLRPFVEDPGLTAAALAAATYRAANGIEGHADDFRFLPPGVQSNCAGCAAWANDGTFGACALYESWTYCGAATVIGRDGRAFHHAFYR
jgi:hypothetical protein